MLMHARNPFDPFPTKFSVVFSFKNKQKIIWKNLLQLSKTCVINVTNLMRGIKWKLGAKNIVECMLTWS